MHRDVPKLLTDKYTQNEIRRLEEADRVQVASTII